MSVYANVYLCKCIRQINIHKSEVHCRSVFEPGCSGLPYYCTPPVCVPAVLGALAVWRFSKKKKIKCNIDSFSVCVLFLYIACLWICVLFIQFESSFVCIFAIAYIFKSKVYCGRAFRFGRALPGYPNTAQHFNVCVPVVLGLLSVWRHNNLKLKTKTTSPVCIYVVIK